VTTTALLALATVVPSVDDYFDKRSSRSDLADDLVRARQTAHDLPKFEARVAKLNEELKGLEARAIDDAGLARFHSRLRDLVRESGCQIRRIEVGLPTSRAWKEGDQPLEDLPPGAGNETPFKLERRSVLLSVDGAMSAVNDLMTRLEEEHTLLHPHRVQLQGVSAGGETVTLELELWLFALARGAA
jgi:hypothetical protein